MVDTLIRNGYGLSSEGTITVPVSDSESRTLTAQNTLKEPKIAVPEAHDFWENDGTYDHSIFKEEAIPEETLVAHESWQRASEVAYDMKNGEGAWAQRVTEKGWSKEESAIKLGEEGIQYMADFNFQLWAMGSAVKDIYSAKPEQQKAILYMMQAYENKDWTAATFGRAAWKGFSDPVNLALMAGSMGTGLLVSKGVQVGLMKGLQTALTFGASAIAKEGAKTVITTTAKATFWQTVKQAATSRIAAAGMASGAAAGTIFGAIDTDHRQHIKIAANFQDDYSIAETTQGGAIGAVFGGTLGWALPVAGGAGKASASLARDATSSLSDTLARVRSNFSELAPQFPQPAMGTPGATSSAFGAGDLEKAANGLSQSVKQVWAALRKTKQDIKQATKSSYTDQVKIDRQSEAAGWLKNKAEWKADTALEDNLLKKGEKTYTLQSHRLNDPAKAERLSEGAVLQSQSNLDREIKARADMQKKLADELVALKDEQKALSSTDKGTGKTIGRIINQEADLKTAQAEHQANIDAGVPPSDTAFIATQKAVKAEERHLRRLEIHRQRLNERVTTIESNQTRLDNIETQQTTLKKQLDGAVDATKQRAEKESEEAFTKQIAPPKPGDDASAFLDKDLTQITLPEFKKPLDKLKILSRLKFWHWGATKAYMIRSEKVTRPVIDAVDKQLQGLELSSTFEEKGSVRKFSDWKNAFKDTFAATLWKKIPVGEPKKGAIQQLQDELIKAAKEGKSEQELKGIINTFRDTNKEKLRHFRASIQKLRAHVQEEYKTSDDAGTWRVGLQGDQKSALIAYLNDMDNMADDLLKGVDGAYTKEALKTLDDLKAGKLKAEGLRGEKTIPLTLENIDDTDYGLFRANFLSNQSYARQTGLWAKPAGKEINKFNIFATTQYIESLERSLDMGYYNHLPISGRNRNSYTYLQSENNEAKWQNVLLDIYAARNEDGTALKIGNWNDAKTVGNFVSTLTELYNDGYGHEAIFTLEMLLRLRQVEGRPELQTSPVYPEIQKALREDPRYDVDAAFTLWANKFAERSKAQRVGAATPDWFNKLFGDTRFGRSTAMVSSYFWEYTNRWRGVDNLSLPTSIAIQRQIWGPLKKFGTYMMGAKEIEFGTTDIFGHKRLSFNPADMKIVWKTDDETRLAVVRRALMRNIFVGLVDDIPSWKPSTWKFNIIPAVLVGGAAAEAAAEEVIYYATPDYEGKEKMTGWDLGERGLNTYLGALDTLQGIPLGALEFGINMTGMEKFSGVTDYLRLAGGLQKYTHYMSDREPESDGTPENRSEEKDEVNPQVKKDDTKEDSKKEADGKFSAPEPSALQEQLKKDGYTNQDVIIETEKTLKAAGKLKEAQKDTAEAQKLRAEAYAQTQEAVERYKALQSQMTQNNVPAPVAEKIVNGLAQKKNGTLDKNVETVLNKLNTGNFKNDPLYQTAALAALTDAFDKDNNGAGKNSEAVALAVSNIRRARQIDDALEDENLRHQYLLGAAENIKIQQKNRRAVRDAQSTTFSEGASAAGDMVSDTFNYITDWGPDTPSFIKNMGTSIKGFTNGGVGIISTLFNNMTNGSIENGRGFLSTGVGVIGGLLAFLGLRELPGIGGLFKVPILSSILAIGLMFGVGKMAHATDWNAQSDSGGQHIPSQLPNRSMVQNYSSNPVMPLGNGATQDDDDDSSSGDSGETGGSDPAKTGKETFTVTGQTSTGNIPSEIIIVSDRDPYNEIKLVDTDGDNHFAIQISGKNGDTFASTEIVKRAAIQPHIEKTPDGTYYLDPDHKRIWDLDGMTHDGHEISGIKMNGKDATAFKIGDKDNKGLSIQIIEKNNMTLQDIKNAVKNPNQGGL